MNKLNKSIIILPLLFAFASCGGSGGGGAGDSSLLPSTIVFEYGNSVAKTVGTGNYTNTVTGAGTGAITYISGTTTTATVDVNTGVVTLVAAGSTIITANKAATSTYATATNTYTLTVKAVVAIGDSYQGGKIAYILQSGDTGYDAYLQHGLIAATVDQSSALVWISGGSTQSTSVPGGTSTAIGTGQANTAKIIAQAVDAGNTNLSTYAAGICDDYTNTDTGTGVYTDWYLPSSDELDKLYVSRASVGGFVGEYYWSSSEHTDSIAYAYYFSGGSSCDGDKSDPLYVRAVRAF